MTQRQRLKQKLERERAHKAFMRRGEILRDERSERDAASAEKAANATPSESPRERHQREQRERDAERLEARRAEHELPDDKQWAMVEACVGHAADLCDRLRRAGIPFFRPRDDIEQRLATGQVRKIQVALFDRTVFVGLDRRDDLDRLAEQHPWLMERRVYGAMPSLRRDREWAWTVERVERREDGPDIVPVTVPGQEMQTFAEKLIAAAPILDDLDRIEIGETVQVVEGPFASFNGVIETTDTVRNRYTVSVDIFGRGTPVELERQQFQRA